MSGNGSSEGHSPTTRRKPSADVQRIARARVWRSALTIVGILALIAGLIFAIIALTKHQVTTETKIPSLKDKAGQSISQTITDTGPSAPSTALIAGFFTVGGVLLVTAAFFNRITEIDVAGVTIKMAAAVAARATAKAKEVGKERGLDPDQILSAAADIALSEDPQATRRNHQS